MVTRVRVEAEGSTMQEVEEILHAALERVYQDLPEKTAVLLFGHRGARNERPGLADTQSGEFVVEQFARDGDEGEAGLGAIVYRGRATQHFAEPSRLQKLDRRHRSERYAEVQTSDPHKTT